MRRCEFCDSPVPADATICPVCREEIAEETLERILPILKRPDAPEIRVLGTTDRLWGVIRRPAAAYRDIGKRPDYIGPLVVVVMNALIMGVFFLILSSKFTTTVDLNATAGTTAIVSVLETGRGVGFWMAGFASILTNVILGMIYLVIGAAFAHFAFKITGGLGRKGQTISIVGYSMIPVILFRLVGLLIALLTVPTYHSATFPLESEIVQLIFASPVWLTLDYMTTIAFVWTGFLLIFGIREAHDTSTLWAILVSIASMIVLVWTFWQVH
ncbi:MAG: YIP1 family protein [Candidatus Thorarchaeota archaeon]